MSNKNSSSPEQEKNTMKRTLSNTHIQLIALGGTIGTGLFLGVGNSINLAGPSVILIYGLVGMFLFLLMRALGELILSDLHKNTYIDFITEYLGKNVGTVAGYLYWFSWLTLAMAEVTALGIYFQFWWPDLPSWIPGTITLVVLLIINLISAKVFGNLEFAFAIIKIVTILAFIILIGYLMITGGKGNFGPISFTNLISDGGFFARGPKGFLRGFQMVIFSFIGVELIGLTASETKNPKKIIPKAINQLPVRIILFYVFAIVAILMAIPWDKVSTTSSPFVQALEGTGIKDASAIINFVVISAAVSATNSFIYSAGRLLFSINYDGKGKISKFLGHLNHRQLPANGLVISTIIIGIAPLLNLFLGDNAFEFISSIATSMFLIIWSLMILTHIKYRKVTPFDKLPTYRMPLFPYLDILVLLFFVAIIILLLWLPSYRIAMISAIIIFIILCIFSTLVREEKEKYR